MALNSIINSFVSNDYEIKNKITFYKTKIIMFFPYETEIINSYSISGDKINNVYEDILKNELDMEYSLCLNDTTPGYDNKTCGYRLTYSISNELDTFSGKIFYLLSKMCNIELKPNTNILPSRVIFILCLFMFIINDTEKIQNTELKCIESISVIRKDKKTNIVFQTSECDDIDELERAIKRVFIFNPSSSFTKKSFKK